MGTTVQDQTMVQDQHENDKVGKMLPAVRRPYRRPVLTHFGDVRDITLGGGGTKFDGGEFDGRVLP